MRKRVVRGVIFLIIAAAAAIGGATAAGAIGSGPGNNTDIIIWE